MRIAQQLAAVTLALAAAAPALPQNAAERVEYRNTAPGVRDVGDRACSACHPAEFATFMRTGMGRSMRRTSAGDPEFRHPAGVSTSDGRESYRVLARGSTAEHVETGFDAQGHELFIEREPIAYSVGSGDHGRSYLIERGDSLFISPLSWYSAPAKWDLTPGYENGLYHGFTRPATHLCVFCHSGQARPLRGIENRYEQPPFERLAIGCERCHGPGEIHVRERKAGLPVPKGGDTSIVNPARLDPERRDSVCAQCHLAGDARVLEPGKTPFDFRPGTELNRTIHVFSVPPEMKGGFWALNQFEQMRLSRCWQASGGKLGCITCHDPHVELHGAEAARYFRSRCLTCHTQQSCQASAAARSATSPPDNCIGCHMPRNPLINISHTSLTDHRIARFPSAGVPAAAAPTEPRLIDDLMPPRTHWNASLRTQAIAFAQLSENYAAYRVLGFTLLEQAAKAYPNDPDVQATWGLVLLVARPAEREPAAAALARAVQLGSKDALVMRRLAELRLDEGNAAAGRQLLEQALELEPYDSATLLALARLDVSLDEVKTARALVERLLKFDPGNTDARSFANPIQARP